jgi:hypothetical protein
MKLRHLWILWLLLAMAGTQERASAAGSANFFTEMAVNSDVQAIFFQRYPDLEDEKDLVAAAARLLAGEGERLTDSATSAERLARRTRLLLEQRTPQEWQRKAVQLFPELGVAGSEFNKLFLRHYDALKQTSPQFMEEPSWPVLLARRCADELHPLPKTLPAVAKTAPQAGTSGNTPATPAAAATSRASRWIAWLSLAFLLAIIFQPARWLFRIRRAFAGSGAPLTVWQSALGPAIWAYLLGAAIALVRTFQENADQRPLDRFGITLLVSFLVGIALALPAYAVALGGIWGWRRRSSSALHVPDPERKAASAGPAEGRKA